MTRSRVIPKQEQGVSTDTVSKIKLDTVDEALWDFEIVKDRLLDVSHWHELSGEILARFQLIDEEGNMLYRRAREGDYLRINIPGPGNKDGEGYDWVRIELIEFTENEAESFEYVAMTVRPCPSPLNNEKATAHFFKNIATSTFLVKRKYNVISAEVHGRNEKVNTGSESISSQIRNFVVGIGAILGFSKVQWKSLVDGLIKLN
ncbi:MAG: hypothetical protein V4708_10185 [Bacteroidota bacterium]